MICAFCISKSPTFSPHSIEMNDSERTLNLKRFKTVYCPDNIKRFSHFLNETVYERCPQLEQALTLIIPKDSHK